MNNLDSHEETIILHIHEHLGPFRDRLSKVEAIVETHSGAIAGIRRDIQDLDKKVDANHLEQLKATFNIKEDLLAAFKDHDAKDAKVFAEINVKLENHLDEFHKVKWLVSGAIALGTILISAAIYFVDHWSIFSP